MASKKKKGGAQKGDTVFIHYIAKLSSGLIITDTTKNDKPMQYVLGEGQLVPGLEQAIIGMKEGQTKTITVPYTKAFGPHRKELLIPLCTSSFTKKPKLGEVVEIINENNISAPGKVRLVDDYLVLVDLNHPLAGLDLIYSVTLVSIDKPKEKHDPL